MTASDRSPNRTLLVVLALLGVLAAAVALPPVGGGPDAPSLTVDGEGDGDDASARENGTGVFIRPPLGLIELLFRLLGLLEVERPPRPGPPAYNVSIEPEPLPDREVTLTVTRHGEPVEGAGVLLNGRALGRTDARGQVRAVVPYRRELVVTVVPPDRPMGSASEAAAPPPAASTPVASGLGGGGLASSALQSTETPTPDNRTPGNATETFRVHGSVSIDLPETAVPGETIGLAASVADAPMRDARVSVNGEAVGRTDDAGRYALRVPDDGTEELRVRVRRGDFAGVETVTVRILDARVRPAAPLALPGRPATVVATVADEPVAGADVAVDGRPVGATGADGGLRFALPADPLATVTVSAADQTVKRPVLGLYAVTGGLGLATLLALGVVLVVLRRWASLPEDPAGAAASFVDRLVQWALLAAVVVADRLQWLLVRAGALLRRLGLAALAAARGLRGLLTGGAEEVRAWLRRLPGRLLEGARTVWRWLRGAPRRLLAWVRSRPRPEAADDTEGRGAAPTGPVPELGLVELWRAFARRVAPGEWRRRTPGEVARTAVEWGLPAGPVDTLTEAFRDAAYGGATIPDERLGHVRRAFERLRHALGDGDGDAAREGRR